jgi:ubiquinone/menaquinone biosynthesis C-methylase UbiE
MSLQHSHQRLARSPHGVIDGRAARLYDRWFRPLAAGIYRRIAIDIDIDAGVGRGAAVLDVGTGPGGLLVELARRRPDLTLEGVDLSREMIRLAEVNVRALSDRVHVRVADGARLPYPDASFDHVISTFSHHHWQSVTATVAEMVRVLRPGGRIHVYDFRFVSTDELVRAFRAAPGLAGQTPRRELRRLLPLLPRLVARIGVARPSSAPPAC